MVQASPTHVQQHPTCLRPLALAIHTILFALSVPVLAESCLKGELSEANGLDWVPISQLTDEQRAAMPDACCGAYVPPVRQDAEATADPSTSQLRASANNTHAKLQSQIVMEGDVQILQGFRSVRADNATYSPQERDASVSGNIQLREPGLLIKAERADIDIDKGNASLTDAEFVLYETRVRGQAASLEKFGDRLLRLTDSQFTSCEPGSNVWSVSGSEIRIKPEDHYGTARHMRLNIFDVPVLYSPYMRFPVGKERLSGFLFPSISLDTATGIDDIEVPYYWNIAPNYDLTFSPRWMSEHGTVLNLEGRHLSQYFESLANVSYMPDDRGHYDYRTQLKIEQGLKKDYTGEDRYMVNFLQKGGLGERWGTAIDYTDLSDKDYFLDLNGGSIDANRQASIKKMVQADYRSDNWLFAAKTEEVRLLTTSQLPYRELPRINADGLYQFGDFLLELNNEYARFDRNSFYSGNLDTLITGERFRTDYQLSWNKQWQWGFLKPAVAYRSLNYQLDNQSLNDPNADTMSLQSPQASIDSGLYFERDHFVFGNSFTQTLEPRIFFLYSEHKDHDKLYNITSDNRYINFDTSQLTFNYQQLFRDTRFAGGDRLDDANQATIGVSTAWIEQQTGVERLRMSIGQLFYFEDRKVSVYGTNVHDPDDTSSTSPIAAQISGQFSTGVKLNGDMIYNHRNNKIDGASVSLRYMDEQYRIVNFGYRYTRDPVMASPIDPTPYQDQPLNQLDTSIIWPVANQWSLIARTNYDFEYQVELDTFAGFEYDDCCYRVRIMGRRWLDFDYSSDFLQNVTSKDYDKGIFLDVQLKGLGNISERVSNLLDKAIIGYSKREQNLR